MLVFEPVHTTAQISTDFFNRMLQICLHHAVKFRHAGLAFRDPVSCECAVLNVRQHSLHCFTGTFVDDARATAERIRRDAAAAVDQELRRAQTQLREEAADLALELAATKLRDQVGDSDRDRLVDEFITRVTPAAGRGDAGEGTH